MSNALCDAVELAFVAVIGNAIGSMANIVPGKASGVKALPEVICSADGSNQEEDPPHSGNFWIDVMISVRAQAATEPGAIVDPKLADSALVKAVWSTLKVDNLDTLLNAAGQPLTVFPTGYFFLPDKQGKDADGAWIDELPIRLYCANSILTP